MPAPERVGLYPADIAGRAAAREDRNAGTAVGFPGKRAGALRRAAEIKISRVNNQHDVILGDHEVVDHVTSIYLGNDIGRVCQSPVDSDSRPVEIGFLQAIAEHDQLSGHGVDLRVRTCAEGQRATEVVAAHRRKLRRHLVWGCALAESEEAVRMSDDVTRPARISA